jgi:hypothetical protein
MRILFAAHAGATPPRRGETHRFMDEVGPRRGDAWPRVYQRLPRLRRAHPQRGGAVFCQPSRIALWSRRNGSRGDGHDHRMGFAKGVPTARVAPVCRSCARCRRRCRGDRRNGVASRTALKGGIFPSRENIEPGTLPPNTPGFPRRVRFDRLGPHLARSRGRALFAPRANAGSATGRTRSRAALGVAARMKPRRAPIRVPDPLAPGMTGGGGASL